MRSIILVLAICIASTYAQNIDLNNLLGDLQKPINDALQKLVDEAAKQAKDKAAELLGKLIGKRDVDVQAILKAYADRLKNLASLTADNLKKTVTEFYNELVKLYPKVTIEFPTTYRRDVDEANTKFADKIKAILQESLEHLRQGLGTIFNGGLGKALDAISPNGKRDIVKSFNDYIKQLGQTLLQHGNNLSDALKDHASTVLENLKPHYDNFLEELKAHGTNAAQSLLDAIKNASGSLSGNNKREVLQNFSDYLKQLGQKLLEHGNNLQDALKDHAKTVIENMRPHYDDLLEQLKAHGTNAAQSLLDAIKNASQSLSG